MVVTTIVITRACKCKALRSTGSISVCLFPCESARLSAADLCNLLPEFTALLAFDVRIQLRIPRGSS